MIILAELSRTSDLLLPLEACISQDDVYESVLPPTVNSIQAEKTARRHVGTDESTRHSDEEDRRAFMGHIAWVLEQSLMSADPLI